jgi:hypothetical protein
MASTPVKSQRERESPTEEEFSFKIKLATFIKDGESTTRGNCTGG